MTWEGQTEFGRLASRMAIALIYCLDVGRRRDAECEFWSTTAALATTARLRGSEERYGRRHDGGFRSRCPML